MSSRLFRTATAALVVALGLAAVPACKKSKPTTTDTPNQNPNPGPGGPPGPGTSQRDPGAPRSPVFSTISEAPMRAVTQSNLSQIGLAMHSFNDTYGALPAGYADKTGKPGLSWRVALLPFIEQDDLFRQFKLDEPWDSDNNKRLIAQMPAVYAPPKTNTNGYTFLRGFTGPNTWLPPQQQTGRPHQPLLGVKLTAIPDGASNTILVAEAYDPVIWTKPDELEFVPNQVPKLGGVFASGFHVLKADATVKFVRNGIDPKVLASAIQTNDGGIVNLDN
jgi:hypothetical protein